MLEDLVDPLRLAIFTVVAAVGSALATSVSIFVGYVITRWENLFFSPTLGFGGILMAYFILLKQKTPTEAVFPCISSFRAHHLPFAWLCISIFLRAVVGAEGGFMNCKDLPLALWSFVVSWVYLRFFQHNPDGSVGDMNEDFQLVTLFPRVRVAVTF